MSGFFDLQDGTNALTTSTGTAETAPKLEPIPENVNIKAVIDDIAWGRTSDEAQYNPGTDRIEVRWSVIAPKEYHGRKIFQNLWVSAAGQPTNKDPQAKRGRDLRMLAAINTHTPGQPLNQCQGVPSDQDLSRLKAAVCMLKLGVMNDRNFVSHLEGATATAATPARKAPVAQQPVQQAPVAPAAAPQQAQQPAAPAQDAMPDFDEEIPF